MTEPTAIVLASLSHRWAPVALLLPVVFGATTYFSGIFLARSRTNLDVRVRRAALAVRVLSFNLLAFGVIVFGISITHAGCAAVKAHDVSCMSNLKTVALGALMYAQDYDDHLPPTSRWSESIADRVAKAATNDDFCNLKSGDDPFHCPASEPPGGYAINDALSARPEREIDFPASTVLFFDANSPLSSFAGGEANLAWERHGGMPNIAFVDGHAKGLNSDGIKRAFWLVTSTAVSGLNSVH